MATVITALKYHLHYPEEYLVTILRDGLKPFKGKFLALDWKKKKKPHESSRPKLSRLYHSSISEKYIDSFFPHCTIIKQIQKYRKNNVINKSKQKFYYFLFKSIILYNHPFGEHYSGLSRRKTNNIVTDLTEKGSFVHWFFLKKFDYLKY